MAEDIDLASADLWLKQAVGHNVTGPLSKADALVLTAKIKGYAGVTWVLIASAHEHKAHKALGYKTWGEYVAAEFDMSRSRSYQLISQAKVVLEISESVSTSVDISEAAARDLEPVLAEAKAAAKAAVEALPDNATDEQRAATAGAAVDAVRTAKQTHRVTESTATEFDTETGEITSPPKVALNPALVMMADLSRLRADAAKWMAFDRHEQVIEAMTAEQRADYRSFVLSVFTHANATLDYLDAPARLKAVQ